MTLTRMHATQTRLLAADHALIHSAESSSPEDYLSLPYG